MSKVVFILRSCKTGDFSFPLSKGVLIFRKTVINTVLVCFFVFFTDEEKVVSCSHMHNTKCQCKSGFFCHPDEPCEVCKKCSR